MPINHWRALKITIAMTLPWGILIQFAWVGTQAAVFINLPR